MSVYLWHMTAAVTVAAVAYGAGLVPSVEAGTAAWWWTKIPFLLVNLAVLVPIVKRVAPIEQRALLAGPSHWRWGIGSMLAVAALLSFAIKAWSSSGIVLLSAGLVATLAIWRVTLAGPAASPNLPATGTASVRAPASTPADSPRSARGRHR